MEGGASSLRSLDRTGGRYDDSLMTMGEWGRLSFGTQDGGGTPPLYNYIPSMVTLRSRSIYIHTPFLLLCVMNPPPPSFHQLLDSG